MSDHFQKYSAGLVWTQSLAWVILRFIFLVMKKVGGDIEGNLLEKKAIYFFNCYNLPVKEITVSHVIHYEKINGGHGRHITGILYLASSRPHCVPCIYAREY